MRLENYEAWIECEGQKMGEYGTEVDGKEAACWIPSEAGKALSIVIVDHHQVSTTLAQLRLDGHVVSCPSLRIGTTRLKKKTFRNNIGQYCPVYFSDVKTTDDERDAGFANDLGIIQISLGYIGLIEPSVKETIETTRRGKTLETVTAYEKSKKMASHCISMGEPKKSPRPRKTCKYRIIDKTPRATFVFRYRKRDILLANGIMPSDSIPKAQPTPTPHPSSVKRGKKAIRNSDVDVDELSSKKRKQRFNDNHDVEVIDLSDYEPGPSDVVVKREEKRVKREAKDIEVIDLT